MNLVTSIFYSIEEEKNMQSEMYLLNLGLFL